MSFLISIHSFRRGTGKTTLTANLAALLAQAGHRVGVIDLNLAAPSLHLLFGLDEVQIPASINDYLWGVCDMTACVVDMSRRTAVPGTLSLVAASTRPSQIARIERGGYIPYLLADACQEFMETATLDYLLVDTAAGMSEEAQVITAVSDITIAITRPDKQDYQGTGILLALAQQLGVGQRWLLVNQTPPQYDETAVQQQFARAYQCDLTAVLPHSPYLMQLGSSGLFVLEYPADMVTAVLKKLCNWVTE